MSPLSSDLRRRIIQAWKGERLGVPELATRFAVGTATVKRLIRRFRETGSVEPLPHGGGQRPKIPAEKLPHVFVTLQPRTAPKDGLYSLRVTVDAALEKDIEELKALLSHKIPNGELTAVVREAVQCALEKHRKRKGAAAESARKRKSPVAAKPVKKTVCGREPVPKAVRREVWKRDEGRCTWRGPDGQHCGSTWKVELDHIQPAALGGPSTVENLRLLCRSHNTLSAEHAFGREHMEACRNKATRTGEVTSSSGSGSAGQGANESAPSAPASVLRRLRM